MHRPTRRAAADPTTASLKVGDYVTDQRALYWVVQILTSCRPHAAILEDCRTLEVLVLTPRDLSRLALRVVRPAAAA
jgi:hypothetical protein